MSDVRTCEIGSICLSPSSRRVLPEKPNAERKDPVATGLTRRTINPVSCIFSSSEIIRVSGRMWQNVYKFRLSANWEPVPTKEICQLPLYNNSQLRGMSQTSFFPNSSFSQDDMSSTCCAEIIIKHSYMRWIFDIAVEMLLGICENHHRVLMFKSYFCSQFKFPANVLSEWQWWCLKYLGSCHPWRRPRLSSRLMASVKPTPGCLRKKSEKKYLCLSN